MERGNELTDQRNNRFEALLEPVYPDLQRWALSLARNMADADELLAQSLLQGLTSIHQLKNDGAFKAWMFRIVITTWRMQLRSRKKPVDTVAPEDLTHLPGVEAQFAGRSERATIVRAALAKLSPEQREALVLFELEGMSTREIAGILGKQETALRVLLHRARARLAALLKEAGIEE
jgi:RNA polymerase sigma-70 factor, ECF subfamily